MTAPLVGYLVGFVSLFGPLGNPAHLMGRGPLKSETQAKESAPHLLRVISGGQTGVDRAALDAAIQLNIPHGGWCPLGRLAEDGKIPDCYQLRETHSADYAVRTEWNVRDSDATLILTKGELSGGTRLTAIFALRYSKPLRVVNLEDNLPPKSVVDWLLSHNVRTLNVAGPRESTCPEIYQMAKAYLCDLLQEWQRRCSQA
mgnify:CR=1 FL=1